jgi:hypothetical protein
MDMQGASKAEQVFRAGDAAPQSGVYRVLHERHRESHLATLFEGERFPACAHCADDVRFVLLRPARLIRDDLDFKRSEDGE